MGGHDIVIGTRLVCEDSPRIAIWTRAGEGNANIWTTTAASVSSTSCQRAGERERRRHGGHRPRATGDRPVAPDVPRAGGNGEALSPGRPAGRHATGDGGAGEPPHTTCSRATWLYQRGIQHRHRTGADHSLLSVGQAAEWLRAHRPPVHRPAVGWSPHGAKDPVLHRREGRFQRPGYRVPNS